MQIPKFCDTWFVDVVLGCAGLLCSDSLATHWSRSCRARFPRYLGVSMQLRFGGSLAAFVLGVALLAQPALADSEGAVVPGLGEVIYHEGDVEAFGDGPDVINFGLGGFDLFKQNSLSGEARVEYRWGQKPVFFIGPMAGVMANTDGGIHGYIGGYFDFQIGRFVVTPAAGPGLYRKGGSKDLGGTFEFHTGIDFAYRFDSGSRLGLKVTHISNAFLNKKNPGEESLLVTFTLPVGNMF